MRRWSCRSPRRCISLTEYDEGAADERRDITIRELAQEQLADMESSGSRCDPELERRLRAAM
jgi:hypothetical protein